MNRTTMMLVTIACLLASLPSEARLKQQQNFDIQAKETFYDHQAKQITYQGSVQATLGTRTIEASTMTVHLDKKSQIKKLIARGKPVRWYDQPLQPNAVSAEGIQLTYLPASQQIIFFDHAHLKQNKRDIYANEIRLNLTTHQMYFRGSPEKPISIIIRPQSS